MNLRDFTILIGAVGAVLLPAAASGEQDCETQAHAPPYVGVSFTRSPWSGLSSDEAEVEGKEQQLQAGLFRVGIASACVDIGLDYQYTRYEYRGLSSRNRDLHRLFVPARWHYERNGVRYRGLVAPGISTSSNVFKDLFDRAESDDFKVEGRFEAWARSGNKDLFGGIAYDHSFGRARLYPVAGIEFEASARLKIRLAFPDPAARLELTETQDLAVRLFPAGTEWHVVTDDFEDEFEYRVEALRAQLTWSLRLVSRFSLDLSAGYEFDRRHVFTDDLGTRIRSQADDEWLVGVSLRFGASPLLYTHGGQAGISSLVL